MLCLNLSPKGSNKSILWCTSTKSSSAQKTTEEPFSLTSLPHQVPPLAIANANCNNDKDLPTPPLLANIPGLANGINESTKNFCGSGFQLNYESHTF